MKFFSRKYNKGVSNNFKIFNNISKQVLHFSNLHNNFILYLIYLFIALGHYFSLCDLFLILKLILLLLLLLLNINIIIALSCMLLVLYYY